MNIEFKDAWEEQKNWLEICINYLENNAKETINENEKTRLIAKAEGLKVALGHMKDSEKIYELY